MEIIRDTDFVEKLYKLQLKSKNIEFFNAFYIDKLRKRGFISKNGSLRLNEIEEGFLAYYTQEYLNLMQSEIVIGKSWIRRFIRTLSKQKHLLRHLLMIQYLDSTIEDIFNTEEVEGRGKYTYVPNPRLDRDKQRERWIKVLNDNPGLNKSEYKKIGKGLYSWLYKNDNVWF